MSLRLQSIPQTLFSGVSRTDPGVRRPATAADLDKLQKLCYWVRIPHHYRTRVWNVLLGVRPTIRELWDFADEQHEVLFGELREAAAAVYGADPTTWVWSLSWTGRPFMTHISIETGSQIRLRWFSLWSERRSSTAPASRRILVASRIRCTLPLNTSTILQNQCT